MFSPFCRIVTVKNKLKKLIKKLKEELAQKEANAARVKKAILFVENIAKVSRNI
jgi:hypothetical protein